MGQKFFSRKHLFMVFGHLRNRSRVVSDALDQKCNTMSVCPSSLIEFSNCPVIVALRNRSHSIRLEKFLRLASGLEPSELIIVPNKNKSQWL